MGEFEASLSPFVEGLSLIELSKLNILERADYLPETAKVVVKGKKVTMVLTDLFQNIANRAVTKYKIFISPILL